MAADLFHFTETDTGFASMYLDVLASNAPAIRLYKKLGYHVDSEKKNILMRLSGIKKMYIMKKNINKGEINVNQTGNKR